MSDNSSLESESSSSADESGEDESGTDRSDGDEVLEGSREVEAREIDESEDTTEDNVDVGVPSDPSGKKNSDETNNNIKKSYKSLNGQRLFPPARKHSNLAFLAIWRIFQRQDRSADF